MIVRYEHVHDQISIFHVSCNLLLVVVVVVVLVDAFCSVTL